jgi:hypothetical protein
MSIASRLTRAVTALAVGAALVVSSAAIAQAAPAPAAAPQVCHTNARWEFDPQVKTPHQSVFFQQGAKGPGKLSLSVKRTVSRSTTFSASLSASVKAAIFASIEATVSASITRSATTETQTGIVYKVPKGQTWFGADLLKHWTIIGHLYFIQSNCQITHSSEPTVQAYQPFIWSHKTTKPFINF